MFIPPNPLIITTSLLMGIDGQDEWSSNSSVPSSKKRKRAYERDDNDGALSPLSSLSANNVSQGHLPLPTSPYCSHFEKSDSTPHHSQITSHTHFRSTFPVPKRLHQTSSARESPPPHEHHQQSLGPQHHQNSHSSNPKPVSPNLSCCSTCHRRPTTVQDLPTYTDCEACGSRTCYICIRTCEGPRCYLNSGASGAGGVIDDGASFSAPSNNTSFLMSYNTCERRGRNVCGKCCVEVGVEGRVWCLVCYGDDEDEGDAERRLQGRDKKELLTTRVEKVSDWLRSCGGGKE